MSAPTQALTFKQAKRLNGQLYKAFKESELLKAANIYSQFDKKGNLYENRLYAKTSLNQARLQRAQGNYDDARQPTQDEEARINNASISDREHKEGMDKTSTIKSGHGLQPSKSQ